MKKIGVISTSRADYSIYHPLLIKLKADPAVELLIFTLGMHLSKEHGSTVDLIKKDGFTVVEAEETLHHGDSMEAISKGMGATTIEMAKLLSSHPVDMIVCLGDRFEMIGAVLAVVPFNIPIAHLHGGEVTEGAIDEKFRHAITKLSDLHFTACDENFDRVLKMGADPKWALNTGALGVESIRDVDFYQDGELVDLYGVDLNSEIILGTYHPVTTETDKGKEYIENFCDALQALNYQFVLTLGNADTEGGYLIERVKKLQIENPDKFKVFGNLGIKGYYSMMSKAKFLVGNSSSGIIEAASFDLPVVNIGNRQKGRACGDNVVHCAEDKESIIAAAKKADSLAGRKFENIYEKEGTSALMVEQLKKYSGPPCYKFY